MDFIYSDINNKANFEYVLEKAQNFMGIIQQIGQNENLAKNIKPINAPKLKLMIRQFIIELKKVKTAYIFGRYDAENDYIIKINSILNTAMLFNFKAGVNLGFCSPDVYLRAETLYREFITASMALSDCVTNSTEPLDTSSVLIGTLRNPKQLSAAVNYKFYHIPQKLVEHPENIKCIALYQSKKLFPKSSGIKYYGKVTQYRKLPRHEIKYIPSSLDDMYYLFEIQEWKMLKKPIKADYMRSPCIFTNLYRFMHCQTTSEITLTSDEYKLCLFMNKYAYTKNTGAMCYKDATVEYNGSYFDIKKDGKRIFKVSLNLFDSDKISAIKAISLSLTKAWQYGRIK